MHLSNVRNLASTGASYMKSSSFRMVSQEHLPSAVNQLDPELRKFVPLLTRCFQGVAFSDKNDVQLRVIDVLQAQKIPGYKIHGASQAIAAAFFKRAPNPT